MNKREFIKSTKEEGITSELNSQSRKIIEDATKAIDLNSDEPIYYSLISSIASDMLPKHLYDDFEKVKNKLNLADKYFEDNRIIEAIDYYEKVLLSSSKIKDILGKDTINKITNRILKYRRMMNS